MKSKTKWHVTSTRAGRKDWQSLESKQDGRRSGQCRKYTAKREESIRAGTQNLREAGEEQRQRHS